MGIGDAGESCNQVRFGDGVISLDEFCIRAKTLFQSFATSRVENIQPDTDLFASGILDSLGAVAFLHFVEALRGKPFDLDVFERSFLSSLRRAYRLTSQPHSTEKTEFIHATSSDGEGSES